MEPCPIVLTRAHHQFIMMWMLFILFTVIIPATITAYSPTDLILLNCGASSYANDTSGRSWGADHHSKYANTSGISYAHMASHMDQTVPDPVPYQTARIFHSQFNYSFPVNSFGYKFVRLYFYPTTYATFNTSEYFFSVTANGFTLLSNFNAFLDSLFLKQSSFMKEFIVNVEGDKRIDLAFSPNPNSFAFINAIEIVSLPETLYVQDKPIVFVPNLVYYLQNNTALETLYRINVGGGYVKKQDDTGMFRYWSQDNEYIFGADFGFTAHNESRTIQYTQVTLPYTAPKIVYQTLREMTDMSISLEWLFPVDTGFYYLLRFHFCEIQPYITRPNERVFDIYIDQQKAESNADIIAWTGGNGIPIFKDYIAWVPDNGSHHGKKDLHISLFPNNGSKPMYLSALINGLEIFKLSDTTRSLAAANPEQPKGAKSTLSAPQSPGKNASSSMIKYVVVGSVMAIFAVIIAVTFLISRQWPTLVRDAINMKRTKVSSTTHLPSHLCRRFSLGEIKTATWNFDDNLLIGRGGFGNVYKGFIDDGTTLVAVKRLNTSSKQGAQEFFTEIGMLSRLRNIHLVSLIGYCNDNGEMILVYEYMVHGTLRDHLYNSDNPPLTWKQRLNICLGAARGLHHLHTSAKYTIIHRDVKSTNILLDENWVAKMSDFGLSKVGPTDPSKMHVTTMVKGSFGYIDPEYRRRQQLTEKSDVYSLGVVLFEVLCNRPAVDVKLPLEQINLAEFAKSSYREGTIEEMVDCKMKDQIAPECLFKFVETAIRCVRDEGVKRPAMIDVVWSLEFAMKLQLAAEDRVDGGRFDSPRPGFQVIGQRDPNSSGWEEMTVRVGETGFGSNVNHSGADAREVFTDLMEPTGR